MQDARSGTKGGGAGPWPGRHSCGAGRPPDGKALWQDYGLLGLPEGIPVVVSCVGAQYGQIIALHCVSLPIPASGKAVFVTWMYPRMF